MGGSDPRGAMGRLSFYLEPISDLPARLQGPKRQTQAFYWVETHKILWVDG